MLKLVEVEDEVVEKIVNIRPKAMDHLQELRQSQGAEGDIFLRMGVRSGGCSGLSYIMDLVKKVREKTRLMNGHAVQDSAGLAQTHPHRVVAVIKFESGRPQVPMLVLYMYLTLRSCILR